ncbi:MAG: succinate dehydrogenase / fumarate reductase cytochrome b subunit [Planctomycetota bacterium]|jgi:succinate dehydrogenase / fumarate reductase cytochrome b subunit
MTKAQAANLSGEKSPQGRSVRSVHSPGMGHESAQESCEIFQDPGGRSICRIYGKKQVVALLRRAVIVKVGTVSGDGDECRVRQPSNLSSANLHSTILGRLWKCCPKQNVGRLSGAQNMADGIGKFLLSSLGKKLIMGLTGLMLVGFLIAHLLGNLTLYADVAEGSSFIAYANKLHDLGPLLVVMEFGLVALFGIHVWMAIKITKENKDARPQGYAYKNNFGRCSVASRSMIYTGMIILGLLVMHLLHFRFLKGIAAPDAESLHKRVVEVMKDPLWGSLYVLMAIVISVHLAHGFRSAFQSLGVNHPRLNTIFGRLGIALAILLGVGFASFPIIAMFAWENV